MQRVASAFGIVNIDTVRVRNANNNDKLDEMHVVHHSMTGMWHIARPTLGVAVVQLTFVESHPMSMA